MFTAFPDMSPNIPDRRPVDRRFQGSDLFKRISKVLGWFSGRFRQVWAVFSPPELPKTEHPAFFGLVYYLAVAQ